MASINPVIEAKYYHREGDEFVCDLCPNACRLAPGGMGKCIARKAEGDIISANTYGKVSSLCVDPVEKKPLYHFYPGGRIFSVGGVGCNMRCRHCQNYAISQSITGRKRTTYKSPEELVSLCRREGGDMIAFTYNEPSIWYEYILDVMAVAPDLKCILISNGLINEAPLRDLCKIASAFNVDIKGFTDSFYMKICGAHLDDVLRSVEVIHEEGVHLELTYLVIPGYNDSAEEIERFCIWVRDTLSPDVPVHFTRFHPDFEMTDVPITPLETVLMCQALAKKNGLNYSYVGNVITDDASDTFCPECGALVIKRTGYLVDIIALDGDRCASCKARLPIVR